MIHMKMKKGDKVYFGRGRGEKTLGVFGIWARKRKRTGGQS